MNKKKRQMSMSLPARPGENAIVVEKTTSLLPDGTSILRAGIDLTKVPVPDRQYAADAGSVLVDPVAGDVRMMFGQRKVVGSELRSLIVISLSSEAVHQFLASCETFIPETKEFMLKHNIASMPLLSLSSEPAQTVAMTANILSLARSGREATAEFYYVPAGSLHAIRFRDTLSVEPVVRVDLPLGLLGSLLDELSSLSTTLPEEIR